MTGMFASFASLRTVSQPVSTIGTKAMMSTPCAMNERMALIWFSCFCCASENWRLPPELAAPEPDPEDAAWSPPPQPAATTIIMTANTNARIFFTFFVSFFRGKS